MIYFALAQTSNIIVASNHLTHLSSDCLETLDISKSQLTSCMQLNKSQRHMWEHTHNKDLMVLTSSNISNEQIHQTLPFTQHFLKLSQQTLLNFDVHVQATCWKWKISPPLQTKKYKCTPYTVSAPQSRAEKTPYAQKWVSNIDKWTQWPLDTTHHSSTPYRYAYLCSTNTNTPHSILPSPHHMHTEWFILCWLPSDICAPTNPRLPNPSTREAFLFVRKPNTP